MGAGLRLRSDSKASRLVAKALGETNNRVAVDRSRTENRDKIDEQTNEHLDPVESRRAHCELGSRLRSSAGGRSTLSQSCLLVCLFSQSVDKERSCK